MAFTDYDKVSLLLPMDGANNGTTFTDWSPSPKTMTVGGNVVTVTAQSKYYGSSAYFDGTSDSLTSTSADFQMGTGDFTVAFWIRPNLGADTAQWRCVFEIGTDGTNGLIGVVREAATMGLRVDLYASGFVGHTITGNLTDQAWNHVAITRQSTVIRAFINGVKGLEVTNSSGSNLTQSNLSIGRGNSADTAGYMMHLQDFIIFKGVAIWTANFTPPTRLVGELTGNIVNESGNPVKRTLIAVPRSYPSRIFQAQSDIVSGNYSLRCPSVGTALIALHEGSPQKADLIARTIPE